MNSLLRQLNVTSQEETHEFIEKNGVYVIFQEPIYKKDDTVEGIYLVDEKQSRFYPKESWLAGELRKDLLTYHTFYSLEVKRFKHLLYSLDLVNHFKNYEDILLEAYVLNSNINTISDFIAHFDRDFDQKVSGKQNAQWIIKYLNIYYNTLHSRLKNDEKLFKVYQELDKPLNDILVKMEQSGILVDEKALDDIAHKTKISLDQVTAEIYALVGKEFNINSPKQLAEILFDELKLPTIKKRSTAIDVLEQLIDYHPIVEKLIDYRAIQKFYSTYAIGLMPYVNEDHRIHTTFNLTIATTGRLSSNQPNLQNISVKDDRTREIRQVFKADENHSLLSLDYSQIELRILAHMANEEALIDAFKHHRDIHDETARILFNLKPAESVTSLMRRQAKAVNFGIIYGLSEFGLAQQLNIEIAQAKHFIERYFTIFSGIKQYMDGIIAFCKEHGYVETLFGRKRYLPDIHSSNYQSRQQAIRAAMNAPIQGSAADIIKIAMQKADAVLTGENRLLLQVHDELVFSIADEELEVMQQKLQDIMENAVVLKVPLKTSLGSGKTWYEVH